ncbi:hypothetical protein JQR85_09235 [Stutzerimonas urumqiensis]|uniref:hypothetical protein n=1 Tax=Stutzerimonas urumqiensis TaxID=638269 RepID=UPI003DA49400
MQTTDHRDEFVSRNYPIQEDMALQRHLWWTERFGWCALTATVLLALAGLFSTGLLSDVVVRAPGGELEVTYQRFERNGAASELTLTTRANPAGQAWVTIEGGLADKFSLESIQPQPAAAQSYDGGLRLQFQADPQGWATARFAIRPDAIGRSRTQIAAGNERLDINQLIYP